MAVEKKNTLQNHLLALKSGERVFENAFQAISRMILESPIEKVVVNGKTTYDFKIFRDGKKHIVGMYDEINSFVSYVKDAAEGGSSAEMAYVLVGEPGNGKTFFVEYVSRLYREFLSRDGNRKYSFRFTGLDRIGSYGRIATIESQTYEDPAVLAMNLFDSPAESRKWLARKVGFDEAQLDRLFDNYRPLGACSGYIWNDLRTACDGDLEKMLAQVEIIPVPLTESL
ncbi:MAG TPA: serine protein kinase PrkA, partial [Candidatus Krumholzibacteria bacterium]|nr:serine protein kinase PrkA [Candidatus Krumholzibacteria bacterium]